MVSLLKMHIIVPIINIKIDKNELNEYMKLELYWGQSYISSLIELANKNGLRVRLWGIFNENIMRQVYKLDIDGMTVNFPDKLKELMEENTNG